MKHGTSGCNKTKHLKQAADRAFLDFMKIKRKNRASQLEKPKVAQVIKYGSNPNDSVLSSEPGSSQLLSVVSCEKCDIQGITQPTTINNMQGRRK